MVLHECKRYSESCLVSFESSQSHKIRDNYLTVERYPVFYTLITICPLKGANST